MAIWGVQTAFRDLASCIRPHELYDTIWYYMILYATKPNLSPNSKNHQHPEVFLDMAFVTHPNSASWWTRRCARCCPLTQMPQICPWPGILVEPKCWALVAGNQRLGKNCIEKMKDFLFEQQKWGLKQEKWNVGHQKQEIYSKNGGLKLKLLEHSWDLAKFEGTQQRSKRDRPFWLVRSCKFNPQFVCRSYPSSVGMMLHHHTPDSVGSH